MRQSVVLTIDQFVYSRVLRPVLFKQSPQKAHERVLALFARLDNWDWVQGVLRFSHRTAFGKTDKTLEVGGVKLPFPLIVAAGFVKGHGFHSEAEALEAIRREKNLIPGWRSIANLLGAVEFGSFTRWPRMGNSGEVIWRDATTQSTQNRVGLKNPGATAAATFLNLHKSQLPHCFGINIAVSPGVRDEDQELQEIVESFEIFLSKGILPNWFTLNLSCPNTEDDPAGNQSQEKAERLCGKIMQVLDGKAPLWVKIGPDLNQNQYQNLMRSFANTGVRAVIVSNTLAKASPNDPHTMAGVGGGILHPEAVRAAKVLIQEQKLHGYDVAVIGCGGVMDKESYQDFRELGVDVVQYWSALVYRGLLAAAHIYHETEG